MNRKFFVVVVLLCLSVIPVSMALSLIPVPRWALIAGHAGAMLVGFIVAVIAEESMK